MDMIHANKSIAKESTRMISVRRPKIIAKRAIGFSIRNGHLVWVPKSQCQLAKNGHVYILTVTEWWCRMNQDEASML